MTSPSKISEKTMTNTQKKAGGGFSNGKRCRSASPVRRSTPRRRSRREGVGLRVPACVTMTTSPEKKTPGAHMPGSGLRVRCSWCTSHN